VKANWGDKVQEVNGGEKVDRVIDVEFGFNLPEVLKCIRTSGVIATYGNTQIKEPKLPFFQNDVYGSNYTYDYSLRNARGS